LETQEITNLKNEVEILRHYNDVLSRDLKIAEDEIDRLKSELHYMKEQDGRPYVRQCSPLKTPPES